MPELTTLATIDEHAHSPDEVYLKILRMLRCDPSRWAAFMSCADKVTYYQKCYGDLEEKCKTLEGQCQVLMMRLRSDLLAALLAAADGVLDNVSLRWSDDHALTIVMAANGYPGDYAKGSEIRGLPEAGTQEGVMIFHAGTRADGGRILANGGRVLNVTATGRAIAEARERAYAACGAIDWPGGFYRRDIGWRAMQRG